MNPVMVANVLFAVTAWLAVPILVHVLLRNRAPELQRTLIRVALIGIPFVVALPMLFPDATPLMEWSLSETREHTDGEFSLADDAWITVSAVIDPVRTGEGAAVHGVDVYLTEPATVPATAAAVKETPWHGALFEYCRRLEIWAALWVVLSALLLLRMGFSFHAYRVLRRSWRSVTGPEREHLRALAHDAGFHRSLDLMISDDGGEAIASGVRRPTVTVPGSWLGAMADGEVDPILLHEIGHHRSHDPLWRSACAFACCVLWPQPLVHWLVRREQELSELAADRFALRAGCDPRQYARLIGRVLAEHLALRPLPGASGLFGTRKNLEGRVRMILTGSPGRKRPMWLPALLIATLSLVVIGAHPLIGHAQERSSGTGLSVDDGWWVLRSSDPKWMTKVTPVDDGSAILMPQNDGTIHIVIGETLSVFDGKTGLLMQQRSVDQVRAKQAEPTGAELDLYQRAATTGEWIRRLALEQERRARREDPESITNPERFERAREPYIAGREKAESSALDPLKAGTAHEDPRESRRFESIVTELAIDRDALLERVERLERRLATGQPLATYRTTRRSQLPEPVRSADPALPPDRRDPAVPMFPDIPVLGSLFADEAGARSNEQLQLEAKLRLSEGNAAESLERTMRTVRDQKQALEAELDRKRAVIDDLRAELERVIEEVRDLKARLTAEPRRD